MLNNYMFMFLFGALSDSVISKGEKLSAGIPSKLGDIRRRE